jgi:transposase
MTQYLNEIALALGGIAGERLSHKLHYEVSRSTLLRSLARLPLPAIGSLKTVGVDDFSFRRRKSYGTLIVDLDLHRPIAILPSREAESLATWLKEYPEIEVLSRDRAKAYKRGMNEGAPQAIQVADRFHLLQNLAAVLEEVLSGHTQEMKATEVNYRLAQAPSEPFPSCPLPVPELDAPVQPSAHRLARGAIHQQAWELYEQGWSTAAIAHQLGISIRTVQRDLRKPDYPLESQRQKRGNRDLEPYKDFLIQRYRSEQRPRGLMAALRELGYQGSERSIQRYLQQLRQANEIEPKRLQLSTVFPTVFKPLLSPLTPQRVTWMLLRTSRERTKEEEALLTHLMAQSVKVTEAIGLTQAFATLIRQRQVNELEPWLNRAQRSSFVPFQRFASSLKDEEKEVRSALTLTASNGQVEGQVNRLKMLKRQMYGRAGTDLLRRRVLLAS